MAYLAEVTAVFVGLNASERPWNHADWQDLMIVKHFILSDNTQSGYVLWGHQRTSAPISYTIMTLLISISCKSGTSETPQSRGGMSV